LRSKKILRKKKFSNSLILDKRKNEDFLINKKTNDYEERNVEIYFADTRGDTHRDSNKPRSAELHVKRMRQG